MKPKQQRLEIAKACGWVEVIRDGPKGKEYIIKDGEAWTPLSDPIPDYLHDLDAMHAAVVALSDDEYARYSRELCRLPAFRYTRPRYHDATAAQRAEAFLKALNLWTDEND